MPWTIRDVDRFKSGLTVTEKRQWVRIANSVLADCIADGGTDETCAPIAIRQANGAVGNNEEGQEMELKAYRDAVGQYQVEMVTHEGREYMIVPVIMMVEGVHHGNHGPLLHRIDDLGKFPEAWNGIPVVVEHPIDQEGLSVSANDPDLVPVHVGRVYHTHVDGGKLKAQAWLDAEKLKNVSPQALTYIKQARPLDVSVGVFTDDIPEEGKFGEEVYTGVATNHRPDHLALLPGGRGACSWADGCGVRTNQDPTERGGEEIVNDLMGKIKELAKDGYTVLPVKTHITPTTNEMGMAGRVTAVREKLDAMDTEGKMHFLEELFDEDVVYRISTQGGEGRVSTSRLYKRAYEINDNDLVEFTGEPIPVIREVNYKEMVNTNANDKTDSTKEVTTMVDKKKETPCCPEKVELLIQHDMTKFEEADREWLSTLDEGQIEKLFPEEKKAPEADPADSAAGEPASEGEEGEGTAATPQMNEDVAIKTLEDKLKDPEQFMTLLPKEIREQTEYGMSLYREKRSELETHILTHSKDVFTAEELHAKSYPELVKLAKLVKAPRDYSAQNTGVQSNTDDLLPPPGVSA